MPKHTSLFALTALASALLAACGGGGGGGSSTSSLSGTVADGYLKGATVCLDIKTNGACDGSEPSTTTTDGGKYTLSELTAGDENKYPVLVLVPATAVDSDNPTGTTVGKPYFLSAPAGKGGFVSPLTTLIQQKVAAGASVDAAESAVKALLGITDTSVSLFSDYIAAKGSATQADASTAGRYARAHAAAGVVATSLQAGFGALASETNAKAVHKVLLAQAEDALTVQKATSADTANPTFTNSGVLAADSPNTLRKLVASEKPAVAATQSVSIQFDVTAGVQAVACGTVLTGIGTNATSGQIKDLRFYVSNVMLIDAQGNTVPVTLDANANQARDVALLDFEDATGKCPTSTGTAATYTTLTGKVPPGNYVGVSLSMGVPVRSADADRVSLNHSDTTAATTPELLTSAAMAWSWQGGRNFAKIEFVPDTPIVRADGTTTTTWNMHLGSTGCKGDPTKGVVTACTNPNRMDFSFAAFNASTQKIVLDLAELFKYSDLSHEGGGAAGCMSGTSDPECQGIFQALQINLANGLPINGRAAQTVFSVKSK